MTVLVSLGFLPASPPIPSMRVLLSTEFLDARRQNLRTRAAGGYRDKTHPQNLRPRGVFKKAVLVREIWFLAKFLFPTLPSLFGLVGGVLPSCASHTHLKSAFRACLTSALRGRPQVSTAPSPQTESLR